MSPRSLRRQVRRTRHLCAACRERRAKYQFDGHVRADRDHVLCFQCFRSLREQTRAQRLAAVTATAPLRMTAFPAPRHLTAAEIRHRERMLAHLRAQAR
jgi:hypothetical protein